MTINILIKQNQTKTNKQIFSFGRKESSIKPLTIKSLKDIIGNDYLYGDRNNSSYSFKSYDGENITNVDIVLYSPKEIGRGIIFCAHENGDVELVLHIPCTIIDINSYFDLVKRTCWYLKAEEFIMDNESVIPVIDIEELKSQILPWNAKTLANFLQNKDNLIVFGALNPIHIEESFFNSIIESNDNELLADFSEYINAKQQLDYYYMAAHFFRSKEDNSIIGLYSLTEDVDSVIPIKANLSFNNVLNENEEVAKWLVSLVVYNNGNYDVLGYISYDNFINNIPEDMLERYDQAHYFLKGVNRGLIDKLLQFAEEYF